ncbi:MAG TPA: hypothetical protein VNZ86_14515 [Bacteroidia bacterium]|jgi:tetratricopeptide (TPR) repeat protein|nr:hypothetical protein [Bacteroidia bacterium]
MSKFIQILGNTRNQLLVLLVVLTGLNGNTLWNQYAYDDQVVLTGNVLVAKGIKGIPELLHTEYFSGFSGKTELLSGARYRPVSLIVFALERELFGLHPVVSHLLNILFLGLIISLLFNLLQKHLFRKQNGYLAFLTCLIFVLHPIHTEIVANVKGRDELITFSCILASLLSFCRYVECKRVFSLLVSLCWFMLALLCKETALTFVAVIPLLVYFFYGYPIRMALLSSLPYVFVFVAYLGLRYLAVGFENYVVSDIGNAPYLFATGQEAFATKIDVILKYMQLLIFPHPLAYDYGYNKIPYVGLSSFSFVLASLVIGGVVFAGIYLSKRRSLIAFSILYFFITLSVGTNLVFDMGAPLAERMLFQPSLAWSIVLAVLFLKVLPRYKRVGTLVLISVLVLYSVKTIARNADWKSSETLFLADLPAAPNSLRVNQNAARVYLNKALQLEDGAMKKHCFQKAISCEGKSLHLAPDNQAARQELESAYLDLIACYCNAEEFLKDNKSCKIICRDTSFRLYLADLLYKAGNGFQDQHEISWALDCYRKAVDFNPHHGSAWYNLSGMYFLQRDSVRGNAAWNRVKELVPGAVFKSSDFGGMK